MTVAQSGELRVVGNERVYEGTWRLEGETLHWNLDGQVFKIESNDDLASKIVAFLRVLQRRGFDKQLALEGCLTCEHFQMSGMARDMGRGQRGVCNLHQIGVEVCYRCPDYNRKSND